MANNMKPIFNVGKEEIGENMIDALNSAIEKRELIKISVLNNSSYEPLEISKILCEKLKCEFVSIVGSKITLYRKSKDDPKIILP